MQAYLGTAVHGFPNLFVMTGPNSGLGHNSQVFMIEAQARYVVGCLKRMRRRPTATLESRPRSRTASNAWVQKRMGSTVWQTGGCRSWYQDPVTGRNTLLWPAARSTSGGAPAGRACLTSRFAERVGRSHHDSVRGVVGRRGGGPLNPKFVDLCRHTMYEIDELRGVGASFRVGLPPRDKSAKNHDRRARPSPSCIPPPSLPPNRGQPESPHEG